MNKKLIALTNVNVRDALGGSVHSVLPQFSIDFATDGPFFHAGLRWWRIHDGFVADETPSTPLVYFLQDESAFDWMFAFVLSQEGGFVDDPNDKGGATKYGVAQKFNPGVDVPNLSIEQAREIYHKSYYAPLNVESLPFDLALACFDLAVNGGVGTAMNILKGVETAGEFNEVRRNYYKSLKQFPLYGQAWLNRVDALEFFLDKMSHDGDFKISA